MLLDDHTQTQQPQRASTRKFLLIAAIGWTIVLAINIAIAAVLPAVSTGSQWVTLSNTLNRIGELLPFLLIGIPITMALAIPLRLAEKYIERL